MSKDAVVPADLALQIAAAVRDHAAKPDQFLEQLDAYIGGVEDGRFRDETAEVAALVEELRALRDSYAAAGQDIWRSSRILGAFAKHPVLVDVLAKLKAVIDAEIPGSAGHEQFSIGLRAIEDGLAGIAPR